MKKFHFRNLKKAKLLIQKNKQKATKSKSKIQDHN